MKKFTGSAKSLLDSPKSSKNHDIDDKTRPLLDQFDAVQEPKSKK
jgi:hypothetical protein